MPKSIATLKQELKNFQSICIEQLTEGVHITTITHALCEFMDRVLSDIWCACKLEKIDTICLVALGSYGRQELQLYSDIDILILHTTPLNPTTLESLERFIRCLWDLGLDVGSQITTIAECVELASSDITVITNLMDHRYLLGQHQLFQELAYFTKPSQMWPSNKLFQAKWKEQLLRYKKYSQTGYILEPNIKNSPGGLRDIQMILWVAQRHYAGNTLSELFLLGFLTEHEYHTLIYCRNFLWQVRFALHYVAGKREDRLLLDYQNKIAILLGYQDDANKTALEKFMKHYFTVIKLLRQYNDMLLQSLREAILHHSLNKVVDINQHYRIYNRYLETKQHSIFKQHPEKLLEIFLQFAKHPEIQGVRAGTIRLMHQYRHLIPQHFRENPQHRYIFIELLSEPRSVYRVLRRMNRYGLLGQYIPEFGKVVGQMQYDLFHAYTVDQHTLFVISNVVKFYRADIVNQFSLCHSLVQQLHKPYILFLAALFHDIAKGRGGDHSELGAQDVCNFCAAHYLSTEDIALIEWLVKNHLLMSQTAQRKDIYDPATITDFCQKLPEKYYLEYLYLLTVADICATNPKLWNSWKDTLLKELYTASKQFFKQRQQTIDEQTIITQRQQHALTLLQQFGFSEDTIKQLWNNFKASYFLAETASIIAKHTKAILNHSDPQTPLIMAMQHYSQGGTEFLIYMPYHQQRFVIATTIFSNSKLNILEARITNCNDSHTLDTYIILDQHHQPLYDKIVLQQVTQTLMKYLTTPHGLPQLSAQRMLRHQRHFNITPKIEFSSDATRNRSAMFLIAADRPGLLANISRAFVACKVILHNAKIVTAGERVEDMFYISNEQGQSLSAQEQQQLSTAILKALE